MLVGMLAVRAGQISDGRYFHETPGINPCNFIQSWFTVVSSYAWAAFMLKLTVCWDIKPRSLVELDRRFGCAYCFHHQDDEESQKTVISILAALRT
jgi:hypothetical protein